LNASSSAVTSTGSGPFILNARSSTSAATLLINLRVLILLVLAMLRFLLLELVWNCNADHADAI
jgi:hypothetical protein